MSQTLAHISDLHIGKSPIEAKEVAALFEMLRTKGVDQVIVTGDITEHGRQAEWNEFKKIFEPLIQEGRVTVLPGNHDRMGDDIAKEMMDDQRVVTVRKPGLFFVCVDTTSPHNRIGFMSHGKLDEQIIEQVEKALGQAEPGELIVVALHHHLLPMPEDYWVEKVSTWLHLPYAAELRIGQVLLDRLQGRVDLVLHGHRHLEKETVFSQKNRELRMYNGGSSTEQKKFRLFTYQNGALTAPPEMVSF